MGLHARSSGCRQAERRIWEMLWARSESLRGAAKCGPQRRRLYNGPTLSRRRRADLVRVKGPLLVNAQRRTGSALVPGPGRNSARRCRQSRSGPGTPTHPQRAPQPPSALGPRVCLAREGDAPAAPASRARLLRGELRAAHPSRSQDQRKRCLPYPAGGPPSLLAPRRRRRRSPVRP